MVFPYVHPGITAQNSVKAATTCLIDNLDSAESRWIFVAKNFTNMTVTCLRDSTTGYHLGIGFTGIKILVLYAQWYGIVEFNIPLDTVQVISETGGPEQWCAPLIQ